MAIGPKNFSGRTINAKQAWFASFMTDVLVYTIVLNFFVEHVDAVVIDSFTISFFTAVLLKVLLDIVLRIEHRVKEFWARREGGFARFMGVVSMWGLLFLSKFAILEIVDLVFGDHVELGHLLEVILLVIALMAARAGVGWIYEKLGDDEEPAEQSGS